MSDKLDRFTLHARHTLVMAQETALRLNQDEIRPEHLLLALAREEKCLGEAVLRELGVEPGQVRRAVERAVAHGERQPSGKPKLTEPTKRVIEFSVDEARRMEHARIATAHLLLGLLRHEEGIAFAVLQALGVSYVEVHPLIVRAMQQQEIPEAQEIPTVETENEEDGEDSAGNWN